MTNSFEERLDGIFDKYTKALTKTHPGDEDIVSFDVIVLDAYKTKLDLKELFLEMVDEIAGEEDEHWPEACGYNQAIKEIKQRAREMIK